MSRKPPPLHEGPPRKRCPVCGQISYSPAGIHPQCAARQTDNRRMTRIKAAASAANSEHVGVAAKTAINPWHTTCPKCHAVVHIRRKVCECGQPLSENRS